MRKLFSINVSWIIGLVMLAAADGTAQVTGSAADFRSDYSAALVPVVNAEVTHTDIYNSIAVRGISLPQPKAGIGGWFEGGSMGLQGQATLSGEGSRYGVKAFGQNGSAENKGVYGQAWGPDSSYNYGVHGNGSCDGTCLAYGVYSSGDLGYSGSLVGPPSDLKFKEYVEEMGSVLSDLLKLEVVSYQHKLDPEYEHMNLPQGRQIGFIAQQVAEVFPELVVEAAHPPRQDPEDSKNLGEPIRYQALKMMRMIPILVMAVQEQQAEIESLRAEISPLRRRLAELEGAEQGSTRMASVLETGK